jgi:hypothetical protein
VSLDSPWLSVADSALRRASREFSVYSVK